MRGLLLACLLGLAAGARAQSPLLDDFTTPQAWSVQASDDVRASAHPGPDGRGLCVDFDFARAGGYVALRRALPIEFPPHFEFELAMRGAAPPVEWQFKLVDAGGQNVWWARRPDIALAAQWQTVRVRQRQIGFAWGPSADRQLTRTAGVELVIASGRTSGAGTACFDRLALHRLPDLTPSAAPVALAGGAGSTFDLGARRDFDVLRLHWHDDAASDYAIELSDDGQQWQRARDVTRARGAWQSHWLLDARARYVRIVADGGRHRPAPWVDQVSLDDAPDANAYFGQLAAAAARGRYPRAYVGEQSYWTVLGVDGGRSAALLSEDGVLERSPGEGGLEPFLVDGDRVLGWADARATHDLLEGDLPMPRVRWRTRGWALDVQAFGAGAPGQAEVLARYTVRNLGRVARDVRLALAWRPFQANPPTQFLAHPGGVSRTADLAWDGTSLRLGGEPVLQPVDPPQAVGIEPLAAGPVGDWLAGLAGAAAGPPRPDPAGYASAALVYRLHLAPGQQRTVRVALPLEGAPGVPSGADVERWQARTAAHWRERLDRVGIRGPAPVADVVRTLRSALGQVLVNRSGPALQPGSRAYARSWIRDGALSSAALLRLGQDDVVRDFLRWYAPFQFDSGKVPCCATAAGGADPVPENDSDGEFAFAVNELWRYTRDADTARALWPHVRAAVAHMETLRQSERGDANRGALRAAYFGLMPPSISHEGYSDRPAYSYWDDFWAAIGYRSGAELAEALALPDDARRIRAQGAQFDAELLDSLAAAGRQHDLTLLPGSADRGDVDPTSSTIALSPLGWLGRLPQPVVVATFERYWQEFEARRAGGVRWEAYTPYEWRVVGSLVRLGQRDRARQVMDFLYRDRRPPGWNQWAEVVGRRPREPRFLGDMPHGWVASDQIRAVLDLFAYEQERTQALVLAAGVPFDWLAGPGLEVRELRTPFGALSWRARLHTAGGVRTVEFDLDPLRRVPPGGIRLSGPWRSTARVWVDGQRRFADASAIALRAPCHVRIEDAGAAAPSRPQGRAGVREDGATARAASL